MCSLQTASYSYATKLFVLCLVQPSLSSVQRSTCTQALYHFTSSDDTVQFQQDLNQLFKWSTTWQLKFNVTKCTVMHFICMFVQGKKFVLNTLFCQSFAV